MITAVFQTLDGIVSRDAALIPFPPPKEVRRPILPQMSLTLVSEETPSRTSESEERIRTYLLSSIQYQEGPDGERIPYRAWYREVKR